MTGLTGEAEGNESHPIVGELNLMGVSADRLAIDDAGDEGKTEVDAAFEAALARTETALSSEGVPIGDDLVKGNLEELLLLLLSVRGRGDGKTLRSDLRRLFETDVSPGTVYPTLHELAEAGAIEMRELVRRKEYRVVEESIARGAIERAAIQHLAFGLLLEAYLDRERGPDEVPIDDHDSEPGGRTHR